MNIAIKLQAKINKLQIKINNYGNYTRAALAKMVIELLALEGKLEQLQLQSSKETKMTTPSAPYLVMLQKIKKIAATEDLRLLIDASVSCNINIKQEVIKSLNFLRDNYSKKMATLVNRIYKQMSTLEHGKTAFFLSQVQTLMA